MREKPVNEKTVEKYIEFLFAVKANSGGDPNIVTLSEIASNHGVNQSSPAALIQLGVIRKETKIIWHWIADTRPSKGMALQLLNHLLHKNKKTVHYPIPDFAAFGESLKEITDRLAYLTVQQEKWLKSAKNTEISNDPANLFRVDDQRLYIAGQIASAMYYGLSSPDNPASYEIANNGVVKATDDLMKKLLNRDQKSTELIMPQSVVLIGACKICEKGIYNDEPSCTDGVFNWCKDHMPNPGLINMP